MPTTPNTNSPSPVLPNPADATNAVASAEIPDIRGLKDMVDIPTGNEWVLWLFVAAAALVVAGVAAWFVRRSLARRSVELAPSPPPPPHVAAWERLQRALGLIHEAGRFCVEVSHIIRVYLEERFSLHAPDRTTEEFLFELQSSQRLATEHKQLLADFLGACDMVKFAKAEPPEQELRDLHEAASRLVGETQPSLREETGGEEEAQAEE